jgi:hypothetical protein
VTEIGFIGSAQAPVGFPTASFALDKLSKGNSSFIYSEIEVITLCEKCKTAPSSEDVSCVAEPSIIEVKSSESSDVRIFDEVFKLF